MKSSSLKGRVVVLDFWATWCTGCKVEIPWFIEFEQKYKNQGLTTIGVAIDDDGWTNVKPYIGQNKINYGVVIGTDALAKQYGVTALPVTVLIDRDGRIADTHVGVVAKNAWEKQIQTLLREKPRRSR